MITKIWQTTDPDRYVAEELFGWRWLSFVGIPVRGTKCYPNKCRVRQFFPPDNELGKRWLEHLAEHEVASATMKEPLDYCYCSSHGPHCVPHFSGDEYCVKAMERELAKRNLFGKYHELLAQQIDCELSDTEKLTLADCESKCIAALAAVGSKYVYEEEREQGAGTAEASNE